MNLPDIQTARDAIRTEGAKAAHDRWCSGGYIEVYDGAYHQRMFCDYCAEVGAKAATDVQIKASGIPPRYLPVGWDDLKMVEPLPLLKRASERINAIINAGDNLILTGPGGTGKTQSAVLLVRAAIEAGRTATLVNIGRLAMEVRAGYDQPGGVKEPDVVQDLSRADLLVLDDVGAGEAGDAKIENRMLYFITEARQNAKKPTIITSNLNAQQLATFLGPRIMNRLMPAEHLVFTHGENFRDKKGTQWSDRRNGNGK